MSNDDVNGDWNVKTSTPRSAKPFKPYTEEPECEMHHKSSKRERLEDSRLSFSEECFDIAP